MDLSEACRVLGVVAETALADARDRFRALMRTNHPDHAGSGNTAAAARITEAYAVFRRSHDHLVGPADQRLQPGTAGNGTAPVAPSAPWNARTRLAEGLVRVVDTDTIGIEVSREEAMLALLDVAQEIGEVSFVDMDLGLLEAIVQFVDTPTCSLVISLQGRADRVDAFCTIESFDARPAPRVAQVTWLLANELTRSS